MMNVKVIHWPTGDAVQVASTVGNQHPHLRLPFSDMIIELIMSKVEGEEAGASASATLNLLSDKTGELLYKIRIDID